MMRTTLAPMIAAAALAVAATVPAGAQERDPAYQSARENGRVGEKMDGYLGVVRGADPALRAMVDDINIRRRAVFAQRARAENATLEEYAFTAGCIAIARTAPGEMYQAPDGSWRERTAAAPLRDPRCP